MGDSLSRALDAAAFFDRLAHTVARSPKFVRELKGELRLPERFRERVEWERKSEAEMEQGRATIVRERERWFAERRVS